MLTYACPKCGETLQSPEDQAGTSLTCPHCKEAITVPKTAKKDNTMLWVVGILGGLFVGCVGLGMVIIVCLAAISVLGSNASGKFKAVSDTIGTAPPRPPAKP